MFNKFILSLVFYITWITTKFSITWEDGKPYIWHQDMKCCHLNAGYSCLPTLGFKVKLLVRFYNVEKSK